METHQVVSEVWDILQGTFMSSARRLVNDIAKRQNTDPKTLWAKINPTIRIGIINVDLPDPLPKSCAYPTKNADGAIRIRCRAPCLLGFAACSKHISMPLPPDSELATVDRIIDMNGQQYFLHNEHVINKNNQIRGVVEDDVLHLYEKVSRPSLPLHLQSQSPS